MALEIFFPWWFREKTKTNSLTYAKNPTASVHQKRAKWSSFSRWSSAVHGGFFIIRGSFARRQIQQSPPLLYIYIFFTPILIKCLMIHPPVMLWSEQNGILHEWGGQRQKKKRFFFAASNNVDKTHLHQTENRISTSPSKRLMKIDAHLANIIKLKSLWG